MKTTTFQDRMDVAIDRAGGPKVGQSEIARRVNTAYGTKLKPQNIQYLASHTPGKNGKLAQGSKHTAQIASVVGLVPEWLASGRGPMSAPGWKPTKAMKAQSGADGLTKARVVHVKIKETGEIIAVELTKDAIKFAQAFMDMAVEDRRAIMRQIRANEVKRNLDLPAIPDHELDHLAAPGTEAAKRAKARKAAKTPKPANPMSRHSQ